MVTGCDEFATSLFAKSGEQIIVVFIINHKDIPKNIVNHARYFITSRVHVLQNS